MTRKTQKDNIFFISSEFEWNRDNLVSSMNEIPFYEKLETRKMTRQQKTLIRTFARRATLEVFHYFICVRQNLLNFIMHEKLYSMCCYSLNRSSCGKKKGINQFATKEI